MYRTKVYNERTIRPECIYGGLLGLPNPTFGTEKGVAVGAKPAELVCSRFITYDTDKNNADLAAIGVLSRTDPKSNIPHTQKFIHVNTHIALNFVASLFTRTRHYTRQNEIDRAISAIT